MSRRINKIKLFVNQNEKSEIVAKDLEMELKKYDFEGLVLTSFGKAEEYLKQHYGLTYNVLPDDELRRVGLNEIQFKEPIT